MPDLRFELLEGPYLLGENRAAFRWRGTGTLTGPLDPPGFAPTGKRFEIDGADFHEYRDGRISRLRILFDVNGASQQLGLVPLPGSRTERVAVALQRLGRRFARAVQGEPAPLPGRLQECTRPTRTSPGCSG